VGHVLKADRSLVPDAFFAQSDPRTRFAIHKGVVYLRRNLETKDSLQRTAMDLGNVGYELIITDKHVIFAVPMLDKTQQRRLATMSTVLGEAAK
jgi:hypothetical protein